MPEQEDVWISGVAAERILGIGCHKIAKVAEAASIRRKVIPGLWPRYHKGDCERLARESVRGHELATAK